MIRWRELRKFKCAARLGERRLAAGAADVAAERERLVPRRARDVPEHWAHQVSEKQVNRCSSERERERENTTRRDMAVIEADGLSHIVTVGGGGKVR